MLTKNIQKKKQTEGEANKQESWNMEIKERVVSVLVSILETEIGMLWDDDVPEDQFLQLFCKSVYIMLEVYIFYIP